MCVAVIQKIEEMQNQASGVKLKEQSFSIGWFKTAGAEGRGMCERGPGCYWQKLRRVGRR